MKTCSGCGLEKQESEYYLKSLGGGLRSRCKICLGKKSKEQLGNRKFSVPEKKECPECKVILNATEFGPSKLRVDGLTRTCRRCFNESNRERARLRGRRVYREKP